MWTARVSIVQSALKNITMTSTEPPRLAVMVRLPHASCHELLASSSASQGSAGEMSMFPCYPTPDTQVLAGRPFPLGAHPEAGGVRFAVASSVAERVELCLIDDDLNERR